MAIARQAMKLVHVPLSFKRFAAHIVVCHKIICMFLGHSTMNFNCRALCPRSSRNPVSAHIYISCSSVICMCAYTVAVGSITLRYIHVSVHFFKTKSVVPNPVEVPRLAARLTLYVICGQLCGSAVLNVLRSVTGLTPKFWGIPLTFRMLKFMCPHYTKTNQADC